jgi:hypothetical protein
MTAWYQMSVKCVTCGKQFYGFEEFSEHVSDTNQGIIGVFTGEGSRPETEEELERFIEGIDGFSHRKYLDRNGNLIPNHIITIVHTSLNAGAKWCIDCGPVGQYKNNYLLYLHIINTGHCKGMEKIAAETLTEFEYIEKIYF